MRREDRPPRVWVLNLDAEHELEARRRYRPTQRVRALVARQRQRLLGTLVEPGDVLVGEEGEPLTPLPRRAERPLEGVAWSPTPRALAALERAGAVLPEAPPAAVLRRVNARPFAAEVRAPLARESFAKRVATSLDEALACLARPAPLGWLVRRAFGAAGRGRRRIAAGRPTDAERAWLVASLRRGPLTVEPWVEILVEYTRSGLVRPDGSVAVSPPCVQETTSSGAWTGTERAARGVVRRADDERVEEAAALAGETLARAGYVGPFGIDAYRHRTARGGEALNPLSEINARYTMDWGTAFGGGVR